ncbi:MULTISPECIES: FAD binding domain-containing protein [unclassified Streptomyces]|uniref:FAD binding domain-containing protein n=1 Tax=unclassified Streptomyces TaxID=2593676 RepID=UPI003D7488A7
MLLRVPTSVSEVREYVAQGVVPIGGATLLWASFQREGFPQQVMSLRQVPEATVVGPEELGSAALLSEVDERVPAVLRRAAGTVGTGAVRRTATVGGNIVGSSLRCLLPPALVLDARATVLDQNGVYDTDLAEVVAKRPVLLCLRWRAPLADAYHKEPGEVGGPPPVVVAAAVHAEDGGRRLRVAVRDGYEVHTGNVACDDVDPAAVLGALAGTGLGALSGGVRPVVREQVTGLLARL